MEARWLKSVFKEVERESPPTKRVKFSEVASELQDWFPDKKYSPFSVSKLIREAFPHSESKACGRSRQRHILGIERIQTPSSEDYSMSEDCSTSEDCPMSHSANVTPKPSYSDLLVENQQLKDKIQQLEQVSANSLCHQADHFAHYKSVVTNGPNSLDAFNNFSIDSVILELQSRAPDLYQLCMTIGDTARNQVKNEVTVEQVKAVSAMCSLLNARSARVNGLQLLVTMMLIARATSRQAITVLSHAGVGMSYIATWSYLQKLTQDAEYSKQVMSDHWIWIYDNLNLHQAVRHEREEKHSSMLNVTARLAVHVENLPDWDVDWSDNKPQRSRSSLSIDDFLPNSEDADSLNVMAVQYVMELLVQEFDCLKKLEHLVPGRKSPQPTRPATVAPMCILYRDEKYKDETIEILRELMTDAKLSGTPQVIIGDQLTCKNIRAVKSWVQTEVESSQRLQWAHEVPGDFHFLWECLRVVFSIFWGTPSETGSLCNIREFICRKQVTKNVKVFNVGDEFLVHSFKAHLIARICSILGISSPSEEIEHTPSLQWLKDKAKSLVTQTIQPVNSSDPVYARHRAFLHIAFLYMDLRKAIQWGDGPHIIRHWKLWLPRSIGTGCKNYATEAVSLIAHLEADFPRHIAFIATHNRTVTTTGNPGRQKPLDQLMEHYVLVVKQALRSSGANVTSKHIKEVSMCALFLLQAAKKCDSVFGVTPKSTSHTVRDSQADIKKVHQHLMETEIATENTNRTGPAFVDPTVSGMSTLTNGKWLQKHLLTEVEDTGNQQIDHERGELDLDYELADTC